MGVDGYGLVAALLLGVGARDIFPGMLQPFGVEVADGDHAGDVMLDDAGQIHGEGDAPAADLADLDLLARRTRPQDG